MKRICKNCKSWKTFKPRKEPKGMESYNFKGDFKVGECKSKKFAISYYPEDNDGLSYMDGEEYSCWFHTAENFGCVHFQGKEQEKEK